MTEKLPTARFIFVDRRKTGRGKSLPNRQKLLHRIKSSIKSANPQDIDAGGVKGGSTAPNKQLSNPVAVARDALIEPNFRYAESSGSREVVLPGNDRWLKGDEFPISGPDEEGGGGGNGPGEDGEDDFVVNISRQEFYDVFFEDCDLPDLEQSSQKELPEAVNKPAGFQKEGTPGQLSVIRSYRNSLGRRRALSADDRERIEELEEEYKELMCQLAINETHEIHARLNEIEAEILAIRTRIDNIPLFEKVDQRFRKTEKVMVKSADAVLMMAMDVSGSMDEERKRIARKFFTLQYVFIKRKYPNTDLVFLWHTDHAEECDEETFFTTRMNGGTIVSPVIELANNIIKERYDVTQTNIYFSYAGDGDNWEQDNRDVISQIEDKGFLNKLRHAVYLQVGAEMNSWGGLASGQQRFWNTMNSIAETNRRLHLIKIQSETDVFTAFKKVYSSTKTK